MNPLGPIAQDIAASLLPPPARRYGRPKGSYNYGSISHLARTMKQHGISWVDEMVEAYKIYKEQLKAGGTPDPTLLYFWQEVLPYISLKMIEKETRGVKPKYWRNRKKKVSTAAIEGLAKAEARKQ